MAKNSTIADISKIVFDKVLIPMHKHTHTHMVNLFCEANKNLYCIRFALIVPLDVQLSFFCYLSLRVSFPRNVFHRFFHLNWLKIGTFQLDVFPYFYQSWSQFSSHFKRTNEKKIVSTELRWQKNAKNWLNNFENSRHVFLRTII